MSTVAKSSLKKTLALLLALCLVFWAVPASAIGEETVAQDEGSGQTEAVETLAETSADTAAPVAPVAEVVPSADAPAATPANTPAAEEATAMEDETPAAEDETPAAEDDTSAAAVTDSASGDTADESAENAAENAASVAAQPKSAKKAPARAPAASDPNLTIDLWEMSSAGQRPLSDVSATLASLTVNGEEWIPYIDDEYNCYVSRAVPAGATVTLKAKTNDYWALSAPVSSSNLPDLSTTHNTEATEVTMTFTMPASNTSTNIMFYECVPIFYDINGGTRGSEWPENDRILIPKSVAASFASVDETEALPDTLDEDFATPPAGNVFAGMQITDKNGVHTAAPGEKFTGLNYSEGATYKMLWATPYTVTFDTDGLYDAVPSQTVKDGEKATAPASPVLGTSANNNSTTFLGFDAWYTKPVSEIPAGKALEYRFDFDTPITEDITLYAGSRSGLAASTYDKTSGERYVGGKVRASSAFYGMEGTDTGPATGVHPIMLKGMTATVKAIPDDGYEFLGWIFTTSDNRTFNPNSTYVSTDTTYTFTYTGRDTAFGVYAVFREHTHTLTKTDKVDATCTTDGAETYWTCSECGKMFSDAAGTTEITAPVTIPALGHDWDDGVITTDPTCTEKGVKTYTCKNDASHTKTEDIDALGHDWGAWTQTKAPTCTEAGSEERVCGRDASHKETREVAALGHAWSAWTRTKAPTCTEEGKEERMCANDATHKETRSVAKIDHSWDAGVVATEATCTETGVKTYTCTVCGETKTEEIAALGHTWDEGTVTTEPICTEKGIKTFTCKRDASHTKTEEVAALGHTWGAWQVTKEATETEDGLETRTCARCGEVETRVIPHLVVEYRNTEGDGSTWEKGSSDSLEFVFKRNINDEVSFSHFTGIQVDGKDVAASSYTAVSGSVVVNLKPAYLETLSVGEHTITAIFDDGNEKASADFTITEKKVGVQPVPKTFGQATQPASKIPATADNTNPAPICFLALLAGCTLVVARRRLEAVSKFEKHYK